MKSDYATFQWKINGNMESHGSLLSSVPVLHEVFSPQYIQNKTMLTEHGQHNPCSVSYLILNLLLVFQPRSVLSNIYFPSFVVINILSSKQSHTSSKEDIWKCDY